MKYLSIIVVFLCFQAKSQIIFENSPLIMGQNVTTPSGYSVYVKRGILTEKVTVASADTPLWADYVFQKNYPLMDLKALDEFILKEKHLPNIPTTQEIQENGNNLHQTDAKLLEKIEELTLYIIDLNRQIQEIKKGMVP